MHTRTGTSGPFVEIPNPRLDETAVGSLTAERDRLRAARATRENAASGEGTRDASETVAHDEAQTG